MSTGDALEKQYSMYEDKFSNIREIPRPDFWVGFRVLPDQFEFWQEQEHRLHIRHQYRMDGSIWILETLYP